MKQWNYLSLLVISFLLLASCHHGAVDGNESTGPSPKVDERNVTLAREEILLLPTSDHDDPSMIKINQIELRQVTPPDSITKEFTFAANFKGKVRFAWSGNSGSFKESATGERLACVAK